MLLTPAQEIPKGPEWFYEVKYDGFRAILDISMDNIELTSRNNKPLMPQFPELADFIMENKDLLEPYLPLSLDAELVWLENQLKGHFESIQLRGRIRTKTKINAISKVSPCRLMVFDVLMTSGKDMTSLPFSERKTILKTLFSSLEWPLEPEPLSEKIIQYIPATKNADALWENILLYDGEGLIAKHKDSRYISAKRSSQWVKIKNKKTVSCFFLAYHKSNQYFQIGLYKESKTVAIGTVKDGFTKEQKRTLETIFKSNFQYEDNDFYYLPPSICAAVKYLHLYENELREPHFETFLLDTEPKDCTWEAFIEDSYHFPEKIKVSNRGKLLWDSKELRASKVQFLAYLQTVSSWLLPFCKNKALTVIRYPDGILEERFFQKNVPDYAPAFVKTTIEGDIKYIICDTMDTLLWLGNLASIEFHIPFQEAGSRNPDELVLDLDPAEPEQFKLAVKAALEIKRVMDSLHLTSFIKTSGNRGIQLHIPLQKDTFSYKDTRLFTNFLASILINMYPDEFTVERMKKQREDRLYLDFVQHAPGKTIIAPYSARANSFGGVATPLFWDEVNENLDIRNYTIQTVPDRIRTTGCPFKGYDEARGKQPFHDIIEFLKSGGKL
ncbi:DNA ligase D [Peribacillus deserti]|nr:DNA ligase D [Peribacillus deserti]